MVFPQALLLAAKGNPLLLETKEGFTYNGVLADCDSYMNVTLTEVVCTSKDGDKFWKLNEAQVRGTAIKYFRIPDEILDSAPTDLGLVQHTSMVHHRGRGGGFRGGGDRGGGGGFRGGDRGGFRGGRGGGGNVAPNGPPMRGSFQNNRGGGRGGFDAARGRGGGWVDRGGARGGRGIPPRGGRGGARGGGGGPGAASPPEPHSASDFPALS